MSQILTRLRPPLGLYRVSGTSMLPTYQPGDTLLGLRWFRPRPGQVVVVNLDKPLIKRIVKISGPDIYIQGDNSAASTDSRHFGPVQRTALEARIILKI
jgi:phage repressor protein C with HTH and peptisase S24 domain